MKWVMKKGMPVVLLALVVSVLLFLLVYITGYRCESADVRSKRMLTDERGNKRIGMAVAVDLTADSLAWAAESLPQLRNVADQMLATYAGDVEFSFVALSPWNCPVDVSAFLRSDVGFDDVFPMRLPAPAQSVSDRFLQATLLYGSGMHLSWFDTLSLVDFDVIIIFPAVSYVRENISTLVDILRTPLQQGFDQWSPSGILDLFPPISMPPRMQKGKLREKYPAIAAWKDLMNVASPPMLLVAPSLKIHESVAAWMMSDDISRGMVDSLRKWTEFAEAAPIMRLCIHHLGVAIEADSVPSLHECENGKWCSVHETPVLRLQEPFDVATASTSIERLDRIKALLGGTSKQSSHMPSYSPPVWQDLSEVPPHMLTPEQHRNMAHFWRYLPDYNVIFIGIPKVASTQLLQLALRMLGCSFWNSSILHEIHFNKEGFSEEVLLSKMPLSRAQDLLNDRGVTKAVFFRDPVERLLSCYLDKFVLQRSYSTTILETKDGRTLSFEEFVRVVSAGREDSKENLGVGRMWGLDQATNPHWREQWRFVGEGLLHQVDFIGRFEFAGAHMEELLRKLHLWEEFGASGWGHDGTSAIFMEHTVKGHSTGGKKVGHAIYLDSPDDLIRDRIARAYHLDYEYLGLS